MANLRRTSQRSAIATAMATIDEFTSAQHLKAVLDTQGHRIGLATVYRNLQVLAESGELDTIQDESGQVLYRHCATLVHHHHLVCWHCGRTVEFEAPEAERLLARIATDSGFTGVQHTIEVRGLCASCRAAGISADGE